MICYHVPESGAVPEKFHRLAVPALTWAIFPTDKDSPIGTGKQIQGIWKRSFPERFPISSDKHAVDPEFKMTYTAAGSPPCCDIITSG